MGTTETPQAAQSFSELDDEQLFVVLADRMKMQKHYASMARAVPDLNEVLFELIIYRGMTTGEAGKLLGIGAEAVSKRVRPLRRARGIDSRSTWQARVFDTERPFKDLDDADLLQRMTGESQNQRRQYAAYSRAALREIGAVLSILEARGFNLDTIAAQVDVSRITIARLRRHR